MTNSRHLGQRPFSTARACKALVNCPGGIYIIVDCSDIFFRETCLPSSQLNDMRRAEQLPAGTKIVHSVTGKRFEFVWQDFRLEVVPRKRWDARTEDRRRRYLHAWQERHDAQGRHRPCANQEVELEFGTF